MNFSVDLLYPRNKKEFDSNKSLPTDFIDDLELKQMARNILPHKEDYALGILKELCDDPEIIRYRQDVLEDFLTFPELEGVLYAVIKKIYDFERTVESKNRNAVSLIDITVRLQALRSYVDCVESCYSFAKSNMLKSTGLRELMEEIIAVHDSESFAVLVHEIETLTNTLDNTVQSLVIGINLDKMKRPFEMAVLSFSDVPLKQKTLLSKIFNRHEEGGVQPIGVMHHYDRYDRKEQASPFEIALFEDLNTINKDILNHFSVALNTYYRSNILYFLEIQQQLDFYLGVKRFIRQFQAQGVSFCRPEIVDKEQRCFEVQDTMDIPLAIQMWEMARNQRVAIRMVVNDVAMGDRGRIFILTGPNHGGKTTYTRAVGVCQVLFQAGLMVPGSAARISPVDHIYTHFPKEEVVGINTSRLTQECKQCKITFSNATKHSLILMNEAFSSTTYAECVYIASGFLKLMRKIGCRGIFSTHMIELAEKIDELEAQTAGYSKFISMVAKIEDHSGNNTGAHKLTYKIVQGPPYSYSYSQEILHRFGINFEEMLRETD